MAESGYRQTISQPGLQSFLWTQFLGAFNDNLFKIVVSMLAVRAAAGSGSGGELSLVGVVFILPFLLFSGYAGQVGDVYNKRSVLIVTKSLEIVATGLGLIAFLFGHLELTYIVLFLIALQATFFSPAKYGILPEILPDKELSRANGLLEMSTFVAIVAGTALGSLMFDVWHDHLWRIGVVVVAVAVVGTAASFGIPAATAQAPGRKIDWNPWSEIGAGLKRLRSDRVLMQAVVGNSYFWFLGALLQLVMILFGAEVMHLSDRWVGILTTFAAIGIGAGSMAAGRLSGDKVEPGLAPIGAIGMGIGSLLLARSGSSFTMAALNLAVVGFFGGLFVVPLNALMQQRAEDKERGRVMAVNNFFNTVAIMLASGALWLTSDVLNMTPDRIIFVFGVFTLISSLYVLAKVPEFLIRFSLWLLTHTVYRIRIVGQEHLPHRGPALLVCNHVSLVDGFLVGACVQRFVRFLVYKPYYELPAVHWLLKTMKAIPIAAGSRNDFVESLDRGREELQQGHVVCVFAEGSISRTGNLLPFKRGFERMVEGLDVPVIPVYLDRVWGSIFSFKGGRFIWKWPSRIPYPVTVAFGAPMPSTTSAAEVRLAMTELGANVVSMRRPSELVLGRYFIRTAKRRWSRFCMADSSGTSLTYGRALVASLLLSHWLQKQASEQKNIGLLLPSSVGGALANIAVTLSGKVAVNLNFTAGRESMQYAIQRCGIRTVLTSRVFLSKANLEPLDDMVFMEDLMRGISGQAKVRMMLLARLLPAWALKRLVVPQADPEALAAVIFSSGSTGVPKGVMLTHRNIIANIDAVAQVFEVEPTDVMIGVLPFFHSFGFTGTLWFPIVSGFGVAYHPNPTDAKTIGELALKHRATMLISTPTFCATYVRKCEPEQFAYLRYAMVGAERLREPIAKAFKDKFGLDLLEGYGCTEMSPIVAVNVPNVLDRGERQVGVKPGTVGHPLPGVAAMIVDPETGEGPIFDREGLLLVKGPNLMAGYLDDPARTSEARRGDWYVTGDIALIDDSGFIRITDRLSRFSKIGGEMVPHMKVEESINALLDEPCASAVTGIPDASRGERLVVFFTDPHRKPQELWESLAATELPRLWLPKRDDFHFVDVLPTLGSGKLDLRAIRQMALERQVEALREA